MRRADRLFAIVQYLRGRRLTTAAQLAQWLEVSERTIYRDVADLCALGVPIDGEAGVGYRIRAGFDLPPLMFTYDEIDALVIGARFVESWGGPALAGGGWPTAARCKASDCAASCVQDSHVAATRGARLARADRPHRRLAPADWPHCRERLLRIDQRAPAVAGLLGRVLDHLDYLRRREP